MTPPDPDPSQLTGPERQELILLCGKTLRHQWAGLVAAVDHLRDTVARRPAQVRRCPRCGDVL